jgi:putative colanic acid biosynthesis acetyltransferase WcaF
MDRPPSHVDLSSFDNAWFDPGGTPLSRTLWFFVNALVINAAWMPLSSLRVFLLRLFGARIGQGVVIKPSVNVKYPWKLSIGDHVWIGENVWIDNLAPVTIGSHACLSQGAMLLTGNHDYKKTTFDLMVGEITLREGVWIGARATVCPRVTCQEHAVLTVGSVATKDLEARGIYQGNPAVRVKTRAIG